MSTSCAILVSSELDLHKPWKRMRTDVSELDTAGQTSVSEEGFWHLRMTQDGGIRGEFDGVDVLLAVKGCMLLC